MGKRGPKPSDGYGDKTKVLSTRITAPTRSALEAAAAASGRALSSEVEHRLRRSFDEDKTIQAHLGGRQLYAILRTISATMDMVGRQSMFTGKVARKEDATLALDWLNDPYAYDRAVRATITILEAFRPEGDPTAPVVNADRIAKPAADKINWLLENMGEAFAASMLSDIAKADPTQPPPKTRRQEALARRIASELGSVRDRLKGGKK